MGLTDRFRSKTVEVTEEAVSSGAEVLPGTGGSGDAKTELKNFKYAPLLTNHLLLFCN